LITKLVYKLSLPVIFGLLISIPSYAFDVEVIPKEVIPGDVFFLKIQTDKPYPVKAEFSGSKIIFHTTNDDYLIALVPVDINTSPKKYTVLITHGEERQTAEINIKPHKFKTIKLTLPEGKVTLSPANQKRAAREAELLKSIWPQSTLKVWNGRFTKPTDTEISTVFGVKRIMNEKKTSVHRGMDFRGKSGTPARAINSGTVVLTDNLFFGGNTLIVDHGMGLYSVYMHLSKFNVSRGDKISKEQVIGFVGSSGRATGPHLHMTVKLQGVSVNPESLFKLEL
jgi:murein DD-endopeptidase MepM/ murein hydrolase activator NlpD